MKVFTKKAAAIKCKNPTQIICNENITKYFILDNHDSYSELIKSNNNPCFYEFIPDSSPVNLFFDIEIYKNKNESHYIDHISIISNIKDLIIKRFTDYTCTFIILESHTDESRDADDLKRSYHIIIRMIDSLTNKEVYFKDVKTLKSFIQKLFKDLTKLKIIDLSVYREGLFRTYLSSKYNQKRPFIKSTLSDDFNFNQSFVSYIPDYIDEFSYVNDKYLVTSPNNSPKKRENIQIVEQNLSEPIQKYLTDSDKDIIRKFIRKTFRYRPNDIRDVFLNIEYNCINVNLNDTFCYNIDREHKSNHQYIVIDTFSAKQKCHDIDCIEYKHNEIKMSDFPKELNEIILKCLKVNKQEQELIQNAIHECIQYAIQECKDYIHQNFDENIDEIQFDKSEMVFRGKSNASGFRLQGKCPECNVEHHISDNGYCLKCTVCLSIFPKNQLIPVDEKFKNLNSFWFRYNQLVNNGTVNININNFYNHEEEFSCDVQLDKDIIKDKRILKIINECLDGHKITKLAELMNCIYKNYVYTGNEWFLFDNNKWVIDNKSLNFKRNILELCNLFNKIKTHYESKQTDELAFGLIKNIKSLITKINKPQLKEDILKESQLFYVDNNFFEKLNSKKHLVPFENGVYDLLENKFRKSKREDYINLSAKYDFDSNANNPEVHTFINNILPNKSVRDYVLKKMSECLNGDIPNTNFLMFIGDGANGKSQLLNLMKLTMGEFGEKVEVTLLTRKRNNANEANTEKIKLMNKRFAFLSEPEDGEKINIGLLKELTGSEEIVARGLYQEAVSFVMEAKLYLACNELPEIKGEDTALWRRIRVIDFPSRFVDEPKESNEYKIDRTLPSRMREDISWRQTFMNILINYYSSDIREPIEVQLKTNEYREENNDFYNWLDENIEYKQGEVLKLLDIVCLYLGKTKIHSKESSKFKKEMEKYIKHKFKSLKWEYSTITMNEKQYRGWKDICFINT
jgi:P4 family phage/plasmid primase-like protien